MPIMPIAPITVHIIIILMPIAIYIIMPIIIIMHISLCSLCNSRQRCHPCVGTLFCLRSQWNSHRPASGPSSLKFACNLVSSSKGPCVACVLPAFNCALAVTSFASTAASAAAALIREHLRSAARTVSGWASTHFGKSFQSQAWIRLQTLGDARYYADDYANYYAYYRTPISIPITMPIVGLLLSCLLSCLL